MFYWLVGLIDGAGQGAGGSVTGSLAATEAPDVLAASGTVTGGGGPSSGSLAATEAQDTFQGVGTAGSVMAAGLVGIRKAAKGELRASESRDGMRAKGAIYAIEIPLDDITPEVAEAVKQAMKHREAVITRRKRDEEALLMLL